MGGLGRRRAGGSQWCLEDGACNVLTRKPGSRENHVPESAGFLGRDAGRTAGDRRGLSGGEAGLSLGARQGATTDPSDGSERRLCPKEALPQLEPF